MNKDVIYPTMVIRSQAETIELQEKEIERLNNGINDLEKIINDYQITSKLDSDYELICQLKEKLKALKEGK